MRESDKVETKVLNLLFHLSLASSVASSSAVWKACKALSEEKLAIDKEFKSRLCSSSVVPHLNVDVHALFPGNFVKAQRLPDNVLQLELGLIR